MNPNSKLYWRRRPIVPAVIAAILLFALAWRGFSGSAPLTFEPFGFGRFQNLPAHFYLQFSMWFPRIAYKYVLVPGLLELLFTFVVASFLYREFVRVETEPLFDTSENRPEQFQRLIFVGVILTILVPLFVGWTVVSIIGETANAGSMQHKLPAKEERSMTFMLLVVLNPMIYQLFAGVCVTLFAKRFLVILIPMLTLGLLLYASLLTTFFCLFDNGPFDSLAFWSTAKERLERGNPPEVAMWMTGLFGVACLCLTLWPARKLLVRRNQTREQRINHADGSGDW